MAELDSCPRCSTDLAPGQEYCLGCGVRLPGPGRHGSAPVDARSLRLRIGLLALLAVAGAGVAVWSTQEPPAADEIVTALGGSVSTPSPTTEPTTELATWPRDRSGWTVTLTSIPKTDGRGAAVAVAQRSRDAGLPRVGILDSDRFSSLRPGYWLVFSGVYASEPEAASALRRAKTVSRTARTQEVVP